MKNLSLESYIESKFLFFVKNKIKRELIEIFFGVPKICIQAFWGFSLCITALLFKHSSFSYRIIKRKININLSIYGFCGKFNSSTRHDDFLIKADIFCWYFNTCTGVDQHSNFSFLDVKNFLQILSVCVTVPYHTVY